MAEVAYAALVSLVNVLEHIQHPSRNWIHLDREQIESLHKKVWFLIDFLEDYSHLISKLETGGLESQIADASYAAEDIIESFVVDQILGRFHDKIEKTLMGFSKDIQKVIQKMDGFERKVIKIKEKMSTMQVKDEQPIESLPAAGLSRLAPSGMIMTVGLDDHVALIMDRICRQESKLQMVSVVGMGGIGKTTLARNVYDNPFIVEHFDFRAWVTISQEYTLHEILVAFLREIDSVFHKEKELEGQGKKENVDQKENENVDSLTKNMREKINEQLGERLYKELFGRRYFIVMDDMWSTDAWDELRRFFPDNSNRSRILITTRLSDVAIRFGSDDPFEVDFLNEDESWNLFCAKIFPQQRFPPELVETGKKIAKNCRGLPLALVVIGGLLAKSTKKREYWEYVAENLTYIINSESESQCLKILSLSYSHLPIHLKSCFLYMAMFPEDHEISVSRLTKLWVAEGFLKPTLAKSSEEIAMEYLRDLIDRNLILVSKLGAMGKLKSCIMHDLLRDLCLREAQRENFFCVTNVCSSDIPYNMENKRRLCIHRSTKEPKYRPQIIHALQSASFARSLVCEFELTSFLAVPYLKMLRILDVADIYYLEEILQLVNSRYLCFKNTESDVWRFPSTISSLWNLETLVAINSYETTLPSKIWEMTQLRHLKFTIVSLPDPPENALVLENLQTLSTINHFRCTEEFLKRVPNLKKLKIVYHLGYFVQWSDYCLNNLVHLNKLESLTCNIHWSEMTNHRNREFSARYIAFPCSLKKLCLSGCRLPWEDITIVGKLPNLEVLKLRDYAFKGPVWNANEGEFVRLKFLQISSLVLNYWGVESNHFPSLEHLVITFTNLVELPSGLAELPMLRFIKWNDWGEQGPIISQAKQILEERESLGYEGLQIQVRNQYLTN